jgi:hypothetical protein
MQPVWQAGKESLRIPFPEERLLVRVHTDIAMPPELAWDFLASPEYRNVLTTSDRMEVSERKNGRITAGSTYHCHHGDRESLNMILEWRPFERILTQDLPGLPLPVAKPTMLSEYRLEPIEGGTRLTQSHAKATGPLIGRTMVNLFLKQQLKTFQRDIDNFRTVIERDLAGRVTAPAGEASGGAGAEEPVGVG